MKNLDKSFTSKIHSLMSSSDSQSQNNAPLVVENIGEQLAKDDKALFLIMEDENDFLNDLSEHIEELRSQNQKLDKLNLYLNFISSKCEQFYRRQEEIKQQLRDTFQQK